MTDNASKEPAIAGAADMTARVAQLLSDLNRASSAAPVGEILAPERERLRYIWVFTHLSKFIREIGGTPEQSHYIRDLALMLSDLDDGVQPAILKPRDFGSGRRGDDSKVWRARGRVATGLEALIRSGMPRQEAAESALKDLPNIERLMTGRSKEPVDAILSWHDDFRRSQSRIKNREWADTLEVGRAFLTTHAGNPAALKNLAHRLFSLVSRI